MQNIPDHPAVARTLATGFPVDIPKMPECPFCHEETRILFRRLDGQIVGCICCICTEDAEMLRDTGGQL